MRDGRVLTSVLQPFAELPALPDPQLLRLLLPGGHRRAGTRGLHDGWIRSGVQGGSGRLHVLRAGGKRLATVAAKRGRSGASSPGASPGRGGDSGSEHQGDGDKQQTNSSGCSPTAAPRGRLITNLAGGGGEAGGGRWENGAASPRCPSPPRPGEHLRRRERRPAPQRGGGGSRGRAAARPRAERRVEGSCEGRRGGGKGSGESPSGAPRPQEPAGTCERCGRTLGRRGGKPVSPPSPWCASASSSRCRLPQGEELSSGCPNPESSHSRTRGKRLPLPRLTSPHTGKHPALLSAEGFARFPSAITLSSISELNCHTHAPLRLPSTDTLLR